MSGLRNTTQVNTNLTCHPVPSVIFRKLTQANYVTSTKRKKISKTCHHESARRQEIMAKLQIINDKLRDKLARARHLIHCIENGCDVCQPDNGVPFE